MPVPSEMKKADRFICAMGLKLVTILGYDRFGLPNAIVTTSSAFSLIFQVQATSARPVPRGIRRRPELFQYS